MMRSLAASSSVDWSITEKASQTIGVAAKSTEYGLKI